MNITFKRSPHSACYDVIVHGATVYRITQQASRERRWSLCSIGPMVDTPFASFYRLGDAKAGIRKLLASGDTPFVGSAILTSSSRHSLRAQRNQLKKDGHRVSPITDTDGTFHINVDYRSPSLSDALPAYA